MTVQKIATMTAIAAILFAAPALADEGGAHALSVEEAETQIRQELGLSRDDQINPDAVPPALLEQLGDAVMDEMAVSEAQHQWMDTMMGGEGSESLASSHQWMGYRYLTGGYGGSFGPGSGGGMHGGRGGGSRSGHMGGGMMGGWGMMGNPQWGTEPDSYESPENIVRRRYAEGEITREEYREMMDELGASGSTERQR
ncbi:MAG: hypothetical protein ACQETQ_12205 [Spirochaetota bacterium]